MVPLRISTSLGGKRAFHILLEPGADSALMSKMLGQLTGAEFGKVTGCTRCIAAAAT